MNPREMRYQPNAQFPTIGGPAPDQMAMADALRGMQPAMSAPEYAPMAAKPQPGLTQGAPVGTPLSTGAGAPQSLGFGAGAGTASMAGGGVKPPAAPIVSGATQGDPSQVLRAQILQAILSQQGGGVLK